MQLVDLDEKFDLLFLRLRELRFEVSDFAAGGSPERTRVGAEYFAALKLPPDQKPLSMPYATNSTALYERSTKACPRMTP